MLDDQIRSPKAASPELAPGDVEQWLKRLDQGEVVKPLHSHSGATFATLHHFWTQSGGHKERGKTINSIGLLRRTGTIKSVWPKLRGKMEIDAADCVGFLEIFFSRWRYGADRKTPLPIFGKSPDEVKAFARLVAKHVLQGAKGFYANPEASQDFFIHDFFRSRTLDSNCIIIASLTKTITGDVGVDSIGPFLDTVVRAICESNNDNFLLIFVVDNGLSKKVVRTSEHRLRFLNVERLRTHLKAIREFELPTTEEKGLEAFARAPKTPKPTDVWMRFKSKCCVVESHDFHDDRGVLSTLEFGCEDVLPTKMPDRWQNDEDVRHKLASSLGTEYGKFNLVVTIPQDEMHFRGPQYWSFPKVRTDNDPSHSYRVEELKTPGQSYDRAAVVLYRAARFAMKLRGIDGVNDASALRAISSMGFEIRTLEAFVSG